MSNEAQSFGEVYYYKKGDMITCDYCGVYYAVVCLTPYKDSECNCCFVCLQRLRATAKEAYKVLLAQVPKKVRPE